MSAWGIQDHPDRVRRALTDGAGPARSAVQASWHRSMMLHGLDPADDRPPETVTDTQLRAARQAMEPLVHAAQDVLDRLFQAVGDTGCCVLLTNAEGIPVERRGAASDDETFHRWGLWPGAIWSEAREGTNGIGTCLAEHRALTIHRDQHFHTRNTALSCTTVPVHDHLGRLAGALDVSSCRADLTERFVGLIAAAVADAARAIEAAAFRRAFAGARILVVGEARNAAALLAVDRDDLVIGGTRAARQALAITDQRIAASLPAADLLPFHASSGQADLADAERGAIRRALARSGGNVSAAARMLGLSRATLHRKLNRLGLGPHH